MTRETVHGLLFAAAAVGVAYLLLSRPAGTTTAPVITGTSSPAAGGTSSPRVDTGSTWLDDFVSFFLPGVY